MRKKGLNYSSNALQVVVVVLLLLWRKQHFLFSPTAAFVYIIK